MINRLFVYGTLGPGQSHERLLTQVPGSWHKAIVRGKLYPKGIGKSLGYPAVELDNQGQEIAGNIYTSRQLPKIWRQLDQYEGEGYRRTITQATLSNGQLIDTYIYVVA